MRVLTLISRLPWPLTDGAAIRDFNLLREAARRHEVSVGFLENILADLRRAGLVQSKRGGNGGYWLARPAADITAADVMRVLDGAGRAEARVGDRLPAVWHTITAATMAAAASFTLESMAADRVPPGRATSPS